MLCTIVTISLPTLGASETQKPIAHQVLILNSYHDGFGWTDDQMKGISDTFHALAPTVSLYVEYLDMSRRAETGAQTAFTEYLRQRYSAKNLDLIITTDDGAIEYLIDVHPELIRTLPVVLSGVGTEYLNHIPPDLQFTGVVDAVNYLDMLDFALRLKPLAKAIHVFGNESLTIHSGPRSAQTYLATLDYKVPIKLYLDLSLEEIAEKSASLPQDDIVLSLAVAVDANGQIHPYDTVKGVVARNSPAMPYFFWSTGLEEGRQVGGTMVDPMMQGKTAARFALQILDGELARNIPVLMETPTVTRFHYPLLQRHGIPESALPEGSEIVQRPSDFYQENKTLIWITVTVFSVMAFLIFSLIFNINRRKRAEQTRTSAQEHLAITFDSIDHGIAIFDEQLNLVIWNKRFADLDFEPTNLYLGMSLEQFLRSEHEAGIVEVDTPETSVTRKIADIKAGHMVLKGIMKLPDDRTIDVHRHYLHGGGIAILNTDVTEREIAENAYRQSLKLQAVGQLTGGIAHDFNNLLMVIMGSLELLDSAKLGSEDSELVISAVRAAERGASLTQHLLAFSRRQPLAPTAIDANALLGNIEELLRRTIEENIDFEFVRSGGLWLCEADLPQLENAILNLVINSRDAMQNGGKLTIETANAHLDVSYTSRHEELEPGQYVVISISDTGHGIPKEKLDQVIEPFYTTKEVGKGSGLGLSMVFGFTKQSNGHLAIYSEPDYGTTVRIYLPRSHDDARDDPTHPVIPASIGEESILVVEDELDVRNVVVSFVKSLGYTALEAPNGLVALDILNSTAKIDLILTDVVLPLGLGGRELAEKAAAIRPEIKILYMSGYTENAIVHHGRLDPKIEMIQKPFSRDTLSGKLYKMLNPTK